jgi:hypothetical protein
MDRRRLSRTIEMMTRSVLVGWIGLAVIVAACAQKASDAPMHICTPGNYVFCRCKDRSEGTKLCNEDGSGFAPCEGCLSGSDPNQPGDPEPPPEPGPPPSAKDAGEATKADSSLPVDSGPPPGVRPKVGELFITEIMYDPSGAEPTEEWFEVFSIANTPVTLNGILLRDGAGRSHIIPATPELPLAPGAHKLFVRNQPAAIATGVPANTILAEYGTGDPDTGGVILANGATGSISIYDGATELVTVAYGGFAFTQTPPGGSSIQLKVPNVAQSKLATGWCLSTVEWMGQPIAKDPKDKGSPGFAADCQ